MQLGQKVTVGNTIDDGMAIFPLKGARGGAFKEHIFGNLLPKEH